MDIFCGKCSANVSRLKLHGYPNEEVRVCNKCLYEAGKENEYADKYLGLVRKGVSAVMHAHTKDGTKQQVVLRLDSAFPQFLVERPRAPDAPEPTAEEQMRASRGLAIVDMATIRAGQDSAVTLEITTRSDTLRFDVAGYARPRARGGRDACAVRGSLQRQQLTDGWTHAPRRVLQVGGA
jgi:hypothetical protein